MFGQREGGHLHTQNVFVLTHLEGSASEGGWRYGERFLRGHWIGSFWGSWVTMSTRCIYHVRSIRLSHVKTPQVTFNSTNVAVQLVNVVARVWRGGASLCFRGTALLCKWNSPPGLIGREETDREGRQGLCGQVGRRYAHSLDEELYRPKLHTKQKRNLHSCRQDQTGKQQQTGDKGETDWGQPTKPQEGEQNWHNAKKWMGWYWEHFCAGTAARFP